jgi:tripartite-type tricarboxylate transporter receptor subunit TctC
VCFPYQRRAIDDGPGLPALAQAGVPREAVKVLNTEINRILATAKMNAFLANEGAEPARLTPEAFAGRLRGEVLQWKRIAREAGVQAE